MSITDLTNTPLADVNYKFSVFMQEKRKFEEIHMDGNGLPSYTYGMDFEHRKNLDKIPGLYKFAKTLYASVVPQLIRDYSMQGLRVGPNQFPEIYNIARECASVLGIAIPNIIISPEETFNAFAYACDDVEPIIIVTGLMVQRTTPEELKCVIGHECGHVHCNHSIYGIIEQEIANIGLSGLFSIPVLAQFSSLITQGAVAALNTWSRAAEVSADRAGLICCGDIEVSKRVKAKMLYSGADISGTVKSDINIDELKKQMEMVNDSPVRLNELLYSHPVTTKRVFADMDFYECETFYEWRPDLKTPGMKLYSKKETDEKVKKYIDVVSKKDKKGGTK